MQNRHRCRLDHFLAGAASAGFLSSFLAGAALASLLVSALAAGAAGAGVLVAGAGAAAAGLASTFFSSFLAGSAAKADTANKLAIKVDQFHDISFLGYTQISTCVYI